MRRTIVTCWLITLFSGLGYGQTGETEIDIAAMAEDIEIMQRIINTALHEHLCDRQASASQRGPVDTPPDARTSETKREEQQHTNRTDCASCHRPFSTDTGFFSDGGQIHDLRTVGYYVPGTGVVFTLDLPAATKEVEAPAAPGDRPDLWEEFQNRLRSGRTVRSSLFEKEKKPKKQVEIDHDALDRTIDVLVKTVGEYGSRIEQLSMGESVIITARLNTRSVLPPIEGWLMFGGGLYDPPGEAHQPYRLIVEVPVSAVRDFEKGLEKGHMDLERLKELSRITKYRAHSAGN